MKSIKLKISVILLFALGLSALQAQEVTPAAGGNASGSGGTVSYSVGQVLYTTNTGTNGTVVQGVQQPFEISVITGLDAARGINLVISAYPNPAKDFLNLKVDASSALNSQLLCYQLYDMNGKLLETKKLVGNQTGIVMSNLVPGIYFLKVLQGNTEVKAFKIIKN